MVLGLLKERYTRAGRAAHRAARGERNRKLGFLFASAFVAFGVAFAYMYTVHVEEDVDLVGRRDLEELFKTKPEQCVGTPSYMAVPFFLVTLYSFVGLAVVTDEYFEPTLAIISDDLGLSKDVAGATFMAAGSSAPELLTSVVDAFISKSSVGVGTILGSAMFNILVIVGGSALIGKSKDGTPLLIQGWPLARDTCFYLLSLAVLSGVMLNDGPLCVLRSNVFEIYVNSTSQVGLREEDLYCYVGLVTPLEGLLLVLFYVTYIIFMAYNKDLHLWWNENISFKCCTKFGHPISKKPADFRVSGLVKEIEVEQERAREREMEMEGGEGGRIERTESMFSENDEPFEEEEEEFPGSPFRRDMPKSIGGKIYYAFAFPYYLIFYMFMPTWLPEGKLRTYLLFLVNVLFIGALTMLMVYFATFGGCVLSIDPFIIGMVFLAAGTSVPDALASFIVARDGHGNMAIANALGSNVFDILLGLGLPWALAGLVYPDDVIAKDGPMAGSFVVTNGVVMGMITLVIAVVLFVGSLLIFKMRMLKGIAYLLIGYYILFLTMIILANSCQIPICIELDCSRCGNEPSLL